MPPLTLFLLLAALPGSLAHPTPATDAVTRWSDQYSAAPDRGVVFIFVGRRGGALEEKSTIPQIPSPTGMGPRDEEGEEKLTTWSIAWYLTLLAAFIVFFVFIGLTEICCSRNGRSPHRCSCREGDGAGRAGPGPVVGGVGGPPPPYELFKPPSYSTLFPPAKAPLEAPPADCHVFVVHGGRGVS